MTQAIAKEEKIQRKPGAFEKRIHEIDFVRGFLIALVLMDHLFCWLWQYNASWAASAQAAGHDYGFYHTISVIFEFYWRSTAREVVRFFALAGFSFVSGVSSAFSKNNWIRAGQMILFFGLIAVGSNILQATLGPITGVTFSIDFNIIGVLAWSTLFYCFAMNKSWRSILIGALISFLIASYFTPWLGEVFKKLVENGTLTKTTDVYIPIMFRPEGQADWLPLFPFMIFFFLGAFFSYFVYAPTRQSIITRRGEWERPFCFMGRHSLIIYITHQAILIPFFLLLGLFLGK